MTYLDPPRDWDLHIDPEPVPYWQFASETGHEDSIFHRHELPEFIRIYRDLGAPFTLTRHFRT
jgi:hypothetical protein